MFDNDLEMACFLQDLYVELNERHELHDAIFNLDSILRAIDEFDINVLNGIFIIWDTFEQESGPANLAEDNFEDFTRIVLKYERELRLGELEEEGHLELVGVKEDGSMLLIPTGEF